MKIVYTVFLALSTAATLNLPALSQVGLPPDSDFETIEQYSFTSDLLTDYQEMIDLALCVTSRSNIQEGPLNEVYRGTIDLSFCLDATDGSHSFSLNNLYHLSEVDGNIILNSRWSMVFPDEINIDQTYWVYGKFNPNGNIELVFHGIEINSTTGNAVTLEESFSLNIIDGIIMAQGSFPADNKGDFKLWVKENDDGTSIGQLVGKLENDVPFEVDVAISDAIYCRKTSSTLSNNNSAPFCFDRSLRDVYSMVYAYALFDAAGKQATFDESPSADEFIRFDYDLSDDSSIEKLELEIHKKWGYITNFDNSLSSDARKIESYIDRWTHLPVTDSTNNSILITEILTGEITDKDTGLTYLIKWIDRDNYFKPSADTLPINITADDEALISFPELRNPVDVNDPLFAEDLFPEALFNTLDRLFNNGVKLN